MSSPNGRSGKKPAKVSAKAAAKAEENACIAEYLKKAPCSDFSLSTPPPSQSRPSSTSNIFEEPPPSSTSELRAGQSSIKPPTITLAHHPAASKAPRSADGRVVAVQAKEMQTKAGVPMAVHRLATTSAPAKITSKTKGKGKQVQRVSRHRRDIVSEFEAYFGSDNTKLENWQMVCRDVGIQGELKSITACRKALSKVWVNIYDLIDAQRTKVPVKRFANRAQLIAYTCSSKKFYPLKKAKKEGPVKALLVKMGG